MTYILDSVHLPKFFQAQNFRTCMFPMWEPISTFTSVGGSRWEGLKMMDDV